MTLEMYFECRERSSINYISFAEIITESFLEKKKKKPVINWGIIHYIWILLCTEQQQQQKRMKITKANTYTYNIPDILKSAL